jgi:hypothetical protein
VFHSRSALKALLVAVVLSLAAPAAINAADRTPLTSVADTPQNTNLLVNPSFEQVEGASITGWTMSGDVHVMTFGAQSWPSPTYAKKWSGGDRYLMCRKASGSVTQTVDFSGTGNGTSPLLARLAANYGGVVGAKIRVAILISGPGGLGSAKDKLKTLTITRHYLKNVTTLAIPTWATQITATVELLPADGDNRCRMVADSINLWILQS